VVGREEIGCKGERGVDEEVGGGGDERGQVVG
jgi:hypothetical protein